MAPMIRDGRFRLDEFGDSAPADELRRGVSTQPFAEDLEADYTEEHLVRVRSRVQIWFLLTTAISCLYLIEKVSESGLFTRQALIQLCAIGPGAAYLTWLAYSRHYARRYLRHARWVIPVVQLAVTSFVAGEIAAGSQLDLGGGVLSLLGLYFFSGLPFRSTAVIGALVVTLFTLVSMLLETDPGVILHSVLTLALTGVLVAFAYSDIERAHRLAFLEGRVISELAERDGLTELRNRRAFDEHLMGVWRQAARDSVAFAILMIDLDDFKAFNDTRGHPAGDRALRKVSDVVAHVAQRPLDLAARYGGEELAVILYDLLEGDALSIGERIRVAVEDLQILHPASRAAPVCTVSIGIALVRPGRIRNPHEALELADEALYQAKRSGRNQVAMHGHPARDPLTADLFSS